MFSKLWRALRRRVEREEGFTLIELLVVILIIGILAAVAIPLFLNQQGKAHDSNAESNLKNAQTLTAAYMSDQNMTIGSLNTTLTASGGSGTATTTGTVAASVQSDQGSFPGGVTLEAGPTTGSYAGGYELTDTQGGDTFNLIVSSSGAESDTCTGTNLCSGGSWGSSSS